MSEVPLEWRASASRASAVFFLCVQAGRVFWRVFCRAVSTVAALARSTP